jgi:SCY1-like protein 1
MAGRAVSHPLVDFLSSLDELTLQDAATRDALFSKVGKMMEAGNITDRIARYEVLPHLLAAVDATGASGWPLLGAILQCSAVAPAADMSARLAPVILRFFAQTDRALRSALLQHMDELLTYLSNAQVEGELLPLLCQGFVDSSPALRELTVKSVLAVAPRLSPKALESQIVPALRRMQIDKEPGIRTNTTVCLGKLASSLPDSVRQAVLLPLLTRALKDTFAPHRSAGLLALTATMEYYGAHDIAAKIIPSQARCAVDSDPKVRETAFRGLRAFTRQLERLADGQQASTGAAAEAAAAAKGGTSGSVLGWISGAFGATSSSAPAASNSSAPASAAAPSRAPATSAPAAGAPAPRRSRPAEPRPEPKPKAPVATKLSEDAVGGWDDFDDDVDDAADDDDDDGGAFGIGGAKKKSPYLGMSDDDDADDAPPPSRAPASLPSLGLAASGEDHEPDFSMPAARKRGGGSGMSLGSATSTTAAAAASDGWNDEDFFDDF